MSSFLHVEWTVRTVETPRVKRPCGRCGHVQPFSSTGKFRLNANGNRLDAWLIYVCAQCGNRWNRPFFERRARQSISDDLLQSLQTNDPALARKVAVDLPTASTGLAADTDMAFSIEKKLLGLSVESVAPLSLTLLNPGACRVRLDRVLAEGLNLSRRLIHQLADDGVILLIDGSKKALKKPLRHKMRVNFSFEPSAVPDLRHRLFGLVHPLE